MQPTSRTNDPLAVVRFSVRTRDPEQAHELIGKNYGLLHPKISGSQERFRFSLRSAAVGSIASDSIVHSMSTRAMIEPLHRLTATYVAGGRIVVHCAGDEERLGPGDVGLYPYGSGFETDWTMLDQGLLCLDFGRVAQVAARCTGTDASRFRFLGMRPISPERGRYWRGLLVFVHRELTIAQPAISHPLVLAETEDMLAAAVLTVFPNTTLTAARPPPGQVGPSALRRAVAFIDAHAGEAITLADIASGAGVSARALQMSFATHYDKTPMGYLRQVRMERAHRDLQAADPTLVTVTQIARRWGFAKQSRFAATYRQTYGVNPSQTLHT